MKTQHQLYRELEQISDSQPFVQPIHPQFKINLASLGRLIVKILDHNNDPKITTFKTRKGELRWRVYNPRNGMTAIFHSPDEVLIWLEERYSIKSQTHHTSGSSLQFDFPPFTPW